MTFVALRGSRRVTADGWAKIRMLYRTNGESRRVRLLASAATVLLLAGCGSGSGNNSSAAAGGSGGGGGRSGGQQGPTTVGYVIVQQTAVPNETVLSGRVNAFQTAEVRPQVSGLIRQRFFTEGTVVRAGQPLYQIDARLYRASADQAQANLSAAQASEEAARVLVTRYRPLAQQQAVSAQDLTNAVSSQRQAAAQVQQQRAALNTARINLQFTTVPAPITGRIGRSLVTVGGLVSASQADPLAVIQRLDPMYVDVQQSTAQLVQLRQALASGGQAPASAQVKLLLEDGSEYPYTGTIEFAEVTVDQATGTVTLRARFPNPNGLLLPGMFVRARFIQSIETGAFLVPQQAVARNPRGNATVFIVGPGNKAVQRSIVTGAAIGQTWAVSSGLNPGDRVITQGTAQLRPGATIRPVPANTPNRVAPPQQGQGGQGSGGGGSGGGSSGGGGR